MPDDDLDGVWKALSDNTRRSILDLLRHGPRTTTEIVEAFPHLTRFGVMKHIEVLREAGLVHTREERRQRINSLNVVPIRQIYERWVGRFEELWSSPSAAHQRGRRSPDRRPGPRHEEAPQTGLTDNPARTTEETCVRAQTNREETAMTATQTQHKVVSRDEWLEARLAHLAAEKELTRKSDELSRQRRELPWVTGREELRLRRSIRPGDAGRSLRRPQPADHLPFHARARLGRRMQVLLFPG